MTTVSETDGSPEHRMESGDGGVRDSRATAPTPSQRRRRRLTREAREAFLVALAAGWSVTHAAERAGFNKRRFYEARDDDEAFAARWDEAIEAGTQVLENELHRRALEGYDEDTFDGDGQLIRRVRRYSPALLIFSLKARRPDVYRDNVQVGVVAPTTIVLESAFGREVRGEVVELPESEVRELVEGDAA